MATQAQYASIPKVGTSVINTANTARDGTGTISPVLAAGASGTRIDRIVVTAIGTTTAGMVRLFLNDGTNSRLWREVPVSAATPSATVQAFASAMASTQSMDAGYLPLVLPSGWSLRASTNNAESFSVIAYGGDL